MDQHRSPRARPRTKARARALVAGLAAALVVFAVGVMPAAAAPASDAFVVPVASQSHNLGGFHIVGFVPSLPPSPFDFTVTAQAKWSGGISTNVGWDSDNVRQGQNLDISRVSPLTSGHVEVTWVANGTISPFGLGDVNVGPLNLSKDVTNCTPHLSGLGYDCTATSDGLTLWKTPGIPLSPYLKLAVQVEFDITPEGAVVTRGFSIGGNPIGTSADLSLTDSPQSETFAMSCTAAAGGAVRYALDPYDWAPDVTSAQQPILQFGLMDPVFGVVELPAIFNAPFGPVVNASPAFDLTGSGHTTDLGPLLANNISPTIAPFGTFTGSEGSPIHFSASATSQCPIDSYVWQFSDGTTSYGPTPQRAFADGDVVYSGQLTVTDQTGLSAVRSFSVDVSNAPPTIGVGTDKTSLWGVPVSFHANGSDPGSIDLASLLYGWDFDDPASPVGGVGQDVSHTFANPGLYDVTGTVTDKDGASDSDGLVVTVTKRDTDAAYSGPAQSTPSKIVTLTGTLTDELGQPVAGRTVTFALGTQSGSGVTNSSGDASTSFKLTQKQGAYTVSMTFLGDAKYEPSSSSTAFTIGK